MNSSRIIFPENIRFLTLAFVLSFLGPIVHAFGITWKSAEFIGIGLLMTPIGWISIRHWLRPQERRLAFQRFRQIIILQVLAFAYLSALWVSALRTGLSPKLRDLLAVTATLFFSHFLIAILALHRKKIILFLKAVVMTGTITMIFSWFMLFAKWATGWNGGVMLLKDLVLEKKILTERIGFPYLLKGPFVHPNTLGLLIVVIVPGLLFLLKITEIRRTRRFIEASLFLCIGTLVASLSVLSMIPVILAVMGFLFGKCKRFHQAVCLGAFSVILFFFIVILSGMDISFLKVFPIPGETRVTLWNQSSVLIKESQGGGMSPDQAVARLPYGFSSHNTFYETALLHGIPAFILLTLYLLVSVFILRPRSQDPLGLAIFYLFVGWLIMLCFEILFLGHFWILSFHVLILGIPFMLQNKSLNQRPSCRLSFSKSL